MAEPVLVRLAPWRQPLILRASAYAVAVGVLLFLCLAPTRELPSVDIWDKSEHAYAWFVLAASGLALWPWRPGRIGTFAVALGGLVEVLQGVMDLGRDSDWRDWVADSIGVAAALLAWVVLRRLASRRLGWPKSP